MNDKPIPVNPWLAERIREYRSQNSDKDLRNDYRIISNYYAKSGIKRSWEEHLAARALKEAMFLDPSLRTHRTDWELPEATKEGLYWCHVDTVADLLQITEGELRTLGTTVALDIDAIKAFLAENGHTLFQSDERTYKVPSMDALGKRANDNWTTWTIETPELTSSFDIYRPTLIETWFEQYYIKYEHLEGEEKFLKEFMCIHPDCPDGSIPYDYSEFFQAIQSFWENYEAVCSHCKIQPRVCGLRFFPANVKELESFYNEWFLSMRIDTVKALIDVLERTDLFRDSSAGKFLLASGEGKLNIAELLEYDVFQMLLVFYLEVRIDFENVYSFLRDYKPLPKKHGLNEKPIPVNPWLAKMVTAFRESNSNDDDLREQYRLFLREFPESTWNAFIEEKALQLALQRDSFLSIKIEDTPLSYEVKARLNIQEADRVHDILQITEEELRQCIGITEDNIREMENYLSSHGYHLEKDIGEETYKVSLKSDEAERKKRFNGYASRLRKADSMQQNCENTPSRIRQTAVMYRIVHDYCLNNNIDVKRQGALLWVYCKFLLEKRSICPDIMKDFNDSLTEMVTRYETAYGYYHPTVADAHRSAGKMLMELEDYQPAYHRFHIAAEIYHDLGDTKEEEACRRLAEEAISRLHTQTAGS